MPNLSIMLANYMMKRYSINMNEVTLIIEDEWDYIEDKYLNSNYTIEEIAKDLISIYMVA